jgi:hypothetical protein
MVRRCMFILAAKPPSLTFRIANELRRGTQREAIVSGEPFRALADEHHVRAVLQNSARKTNRIADSLQGSDCPSTQGGAVHHHRIALHSAIEIQMRPEPCIKHWLVFQHNDRRFHGVQRGTSSRKNRPSSLKSSAAPGIACLNGFVGNIPGPAMHNQRRFHRDENGKASGVCPERGSAAVFIP